MTTEQIAAATDAMRLFAKYRASGTVDHIWMNGWNVMFWGHHWKSPWTSRSGLIAEVTMTYSGTSTKIVRGTRTTHRKIRNDSCSRISVDSPVHKCPHARDEDQEEHQQCEHHADGLHQSDWDVPDLLPVAGGVDHGRLEQFLRNGLHTGHQHEERERPLVPDRDDHQYPE